MARIYVVWCFLLSFHGLYLERKMAVIDLVSGSSTVLTLLYDLDIVLSTPTLAVTIKVMSIPIPKISRNEGKKTTLMSYQSVHLTSSQS